MIQTAQKAQVKKNKTRKERWERYVACFLFSVTLQIDTKHSSTPSLDTTEQPQKYTLEKSGIQLHEKQIVINFVNNAFCTVR